VSSVGSSSGSSSSSSGGGGSMDDVIERAAPLGSRSAPDSLAVLSWNVLADCYATHDGEPQRGKGVDHVPLADLAWPTRCARILAELVAADADVVCLQEVEPSAFAQEFSPTLSAAGYDGLIQKNDHRVGTATFWRREKLSCVWENHRSRSLVTVLQHQQQQDPGRESEGEGEARQQQRCTAVVNVHLQGHARETLARVKQLSSSLRHLSNHAREFAQPSSQPPPIFNSVVLLSA
jgi:mRNA deadenylase 3'-5' endonuclease subunit Ccr4